MSTNTANIGLTKLDNGELSGAWDAPERDNRDIIDTAIGYLLDALANAAGSQTNTTAYNLNIAALTKGSADALKKRLDNAMSADGTPIATPEVIYTKFDRLMGTLQGNFEALARFGQLFYWASQGQQDTNISQQPDRLRKEIGRRGFHRRNSLLEDNLTVSVAASVPTIQSASKTEFDIGGKIFNLRGSKAATSTITGKSSCFVYVQEGDAADKLLYSGGDGVFTKTTSTGPWHNLTSATVGAFTNAQPGDIVRLSANTSYGYDVAGDYVILAVAGTTITLYGSLPIPLSTSTVTGLSFEVINPFAVKVGYDEVSVTGTEYNEVNPSPATVDDKAYVGEVHWNGAATIDAFAYRSKGIYDTGWVEPAALASPNPGSISGDHRVGLSAPPYHPVATKASDPMKVRLLVAQKNAAGHYYNVQEVPFNPAIGGATVPAVRQGGWFGYVNRKSFAIRFGVKLPVGAGYGFLRKTDIASFPNDGNVDASYETTNTNVAYRLIVERE